MSKKLTEQKLFNPLIKWIDSFYDTVENTSLFKEDDELIEEFGGWPRTTLTLEK
jgi:hypothetical protein